jgi:hypothetical protein
MASDIKGFIEAAIEHIKAGRHQLALDGLQTAKQALDEAEKDAAGIAQAGERTIRHVLLDITKVVSSAMGNPKRLETLIEEAESKL